MFARLPRSVASAGVNATSPGGCAISSTRTRRAVLGSRAIVAVAENGAQPACRACATGRDPARDPCHDRHRLPRSTATCSDYTWTFATGPLAGRAQPRDAAASRRSRRAPDDRAGRHRARGPCGLARDGIVDSRPPSSSARAWPRARPRGARAPALAGGVDGRAQAGNVVSREPGIYLPGVGGVRIEDMVLVTDGGRERLTRLGKELVTVR